MSIYLRHLSKIQNEYRNKDYDACVRECGSAMEKGLRELYLSLQKHLQEQQMEEKWDALHNEFREKREADFNFDSAGFGGLIMFSQVTSFWDKIRIMCTSNLSFLNMINWYRARMLRNNTVHHRIKSTKNDATEMMFYAKVFMYDCELIDGMVSPAPMILGARCLECNESINREWNFCPHCAAKIIQPCVKCHRELDPAHRICPYCDTQRVCGVNHSESEQKYRAFAEAVWADYEVTPGERQWLNGKRLEMGLTLERANAIEKQVIPPHYHTFMTIIEAVNIDGVIDRAEREFLLMKAEEFNISLEVARKLIASAKGSPARIRRGIRRRILNVNRWAGQ